MSGTLKLADAGTGSDEFFLDQDSELNLSQLELELQRRGFKKIGNHYENPDDPTVFYTVRVSSTPNKARLIWGVNLLGNRTNGGLDDKIRCALRSEKPIRNSMKPTPNGAAYAVGFSIEYHKPDDVFDNVQNVANNVQQIIAEYFKTSQDNITYIDANKAHYIMTGINK
jgi:hypothetical protein